MSGTNTSAQLLSPTVMNGNVAKFKTSPLIDVSNRPVPGIGLPVSIEQQPFSQNHSGSVNQETSRNNTAPFSPQTELSAKLLHTSISTSAQSNFHSIRVQRTTSWSAGQNLYSPCGNDEGVTVVKKSSEKKSDHLTALIQNGPDIKALDLLKQNRNLAQSSPNNNLVNLSRSRSSSALKRVAVQDSSANSSSWQSSQKKIKQISTLESIQEGSGSPAAFIARLRAGSAPTPFGPKESDVSKVVFSDQILITPTKPDNGIIVNNNENDKQNSVDGTPNIGRIKQRAKLPAFRKLPISRSMLGLDVIQQATSESPLRSFGFDEFSKLGSTGSSHKLPSQSVEFRANDDDCQLLIGDMSKKCLLSCRLCDGVPLIDCDELAKLLEGHYAADVERAYVIDCRFPYEFIGGHIKGAVNFPHPFYENLRQDFFDLKHVESLQVKNAAWLRPSKCDEVTGNRVIIIFHCEFSSHRAPNTFRWFRTEDRNVHTIANYPKLDYPEAYVLRGGYKAFVNYCHHNNKQHLCHPPGGYVKQGDSRYTDHLRKFQRRIKTMNDVESCLKNNDYFVGPAQGNADIKPPSPLGFDSPSRVDKEKQNSSHNVSPDKPRSSHEFDDDEYANLKMIQKRLEMGRRRSECVRPSLSSGIGRSSLEELASPTVQLILSKDSKSLICGQSSPLSHRVSKTSEHEC